MGKVDAWVVNISGGYDGDTSDGESEGMVLSVGLGEGVVGFVKAVVFFGSLLSPSSFDSFSAGALWKAALKSLSVFCNTSWSLLG